MKTVIVTGASTGIGRASARMLRGAGFQVFAGVRKETDAQDVRKDGLEPLILDVGDAASIAAAAERMDGVVGESGLVGLVNNAGMGISGPVEMVNLDALRYQYEVNVFGQIAVIQAFLPMLRRARGRLVNVGSVGDHITIPFGGALCSSKCAFASLTVALRMELSPSGIRVILIEPGSVATPAVNKTLGDCEQAIKSWPAEGAARYAEMFRNFTRKATSREATGSRPEVIGEAIVHALTSPTPHLRYLVGKDARFLALLPRILPEWLLDRMRMKMMGIPTTFGVHANPS